MLYFVKSSRPEEIAYWEKLHLRPPSSDDYERAVLIPCGKCIGCRLTYTSQWATRSMLEARTSIPESTFFLTLTYDDEHIDHLRSFGVSEPNKSTGEVETFSTLTLVKRDLQLFMKNLRQNAYRRYGLDNIRFFASGEYGGSTARPHFHLSLFNFNVPRSDLHLIDHKRAKSGDVLFESEIVNKSWPHGFAPLGFMSFNSAAYVAGYMLKKFKGPTAQEHYEKLGLLPEFSTMSRRPGLARDYFVQNEAYIHREDRLNLCINGNDVSPRPPRYFDRLYEAEHGDGSLDDIKLNRQVAAFQSNKVLEKNLNMPVQEYLYKKEACTLDSVKKSLSFTI